MRAFMSECGVEVLGLSIESIGRFRPLHAWIVRTPDRRIALPLKTREEILAEVGSSGSATRDAWEDVGWFHPAYFTNQEVWDLERAVRDADPGSREATLSAELARLYTPVHMASLLLDRYPSLPEFADYLELIREALGAFYSGYRRVGVAALVPVVEGVLFKFLVRLRGRDDNQLTGSALVVQVINEECTRACAELVYAGLWVPRAYKQRDFVERVDDYVEMLSIFKRFASGQLFADTSTFVAPHNLNRHGILHGRWTNFGSSENFHRLWSILDLLAFASSMSTPGVSMWAPRMTAQAMSFALSLVSQGQSDHGQHHVVERDCDEPRRIDDAGDGA